jgi:hypothetical protein
MLQAEKDVMSAAHEKAMAELKADHDAYVAFLVADHNQAIDGIKKVAAVVL